MVDNIVQERPEEWVQQGQQREVRAILHHPLDLPHLFIPSLLLGPSESFYEGVKARSIRHLRKGRALGG